jgi:hypothetical protein
MKNYYLSLRRNFIYLPRLIKKTKFSLLNNRIYYGNSKKTNAIQSGYL